MKLTVMAKSKYFSPKIKLLDSYFYPSDFLFFIAGRTCGRWFGKIYLFLMGKKNPFPLEQLVSLQNYYLSIFQV